jgi:hypothetical protein
MQLVLWLLGFGDGLVTRKAKINQLRIISNRGHSCFLFFIHFNYSTTFKIHQYLFNEGEGGERTPGKYIFDS